MSNKWIIEKLSVISIRTNKPKVYLFNTCKYILINIIIYKSKENFFMVPHFNDLVLSSVHKLKNSLIRDFYEKVKYYG